MHTGVDVYLATLTDRLVEGFGPALEAVCVTGSLALDAFDPDRSDVDVAAVLRDGAPRGVRAAVVERVRHRTLPCPARGLELVVYPATFAASGQTGAGFVLELNDGPSMPFRAHLQPGDRPDEQGDFWYVIDRAITRERGRPLFGPQPAEVFGPPRDADVLGALRRSVAWHRDRGGGRNAVLNACRAARWAHDRTWTSKPAAARWFLEHDADPVVGAALEDAPLDPAAVRRFLTRVADRLIAAT